MKKFFIGLESEKDFIFFNEAKEILHSENINFDFYKQYSKEIMNSPISDYIKLKISEKIKGSNVFVCIIGEDTYKNLWVKWEIETALKYEKMICLMRKKGDNLSFIPYDWFNGYVQILDWDAKIFSNI